MILAIIRNNRHHGLRMYILLFWESLTRILAPQARMRRAPCSLSSPAPPFASPAPSPQAATRGRAALRRIWSASPIHMPSTEQHAPHMDSAPHMPSTEQDNSHAAGAAGADTGSLPSLEQDDGADEMSQEDGEAGPLATGDSGQDGTRAGGHCKRSAEGAAMEGSCLEDWARAEEAPACIFHAMVLPR